MLKIFDFQFYKENYIAIVALIFSVVFIKIFNLHHIPENSLLENMQLIALFGGFIASVRAKNYKVFFTFLALLLLLMFAREISYGRVFIEGTDIPFNKKICHLIVGIYIALSALYAVIKKIWVDIINIVKNIKFPFWTFLMSFGCVFVQLLSEEYLQNTCIEETAEFMLYCLILSLILIYSKK